MASAQVLTVSPQPSEGYVFLNIPFFQTGPCGVRDGTPENLCTISPTAGALVTLTATANPSYQFVGWSGACSGTSTRTTVTVSTNITCMPHFIHVPYTQVATGEGHQCAITTNGTVQCWGFGSGGRLGNGKNINSLTPVTVQGISTAAAVSANSTHTCALLNNGRVKCWGFGDRGQLGTGNTNNSNIPVDVISLSNVISISASTFHTCAVRENGRALCWGQDLFSSGTLGLGATTQVSVPTTLSGINNATAISTGSGHTCTVLRTGSAKCWGFGSKGRLGTGNTNNSNVPVDVTNLTTAITISTGSTHTCALLNNGRAKCWGGNAGGQLGTGNTNSSNIPVDVTDLTTAITISTGDTHNCALLNNGRVQCWGRNNSGQLGLGSTGDNRNTPTTVPSITTAIAMGVARGSNTICAILTDGNAYCWGSGYANIPTLVPGQPGALTPSATISLYSHSLFIAVSPYRAIPGTVSNNLPTWLTYSAATGAFFGIPTSAASAITITAGSNPPFPLSPARFSISIKALPTSFTIDDADSRANNIPTDAKLNAQLVNPKPIAKDQSNSETQIPLRWSLTHTAERFSINANTGALILTGSITESQPYTITVQADFPTLTEALFQPSLPAVTSSQSFVINGVAVSDPLMLHLKTFLEGPLQ